MKIFLSFIIQLILLVFLFSVYSIYTGRLDTANIPTEDGLTGNIISCSPKTQKNNILSPGIDSLAEIFSNDNRQSAGQLRNGVLYLDLEARTGAWYPETHDGSGLRVHAFAEAGKPMQIPGPQIKAQEGSLIKGQIKNLISEHSLVLYGFFPRPGNIHDSVVIKTGETYHFSFIAGKAGTYFYRAYASDSLDENLPFFNDSQLYGAFIVDPRGQKPDPLERIMIIGIWNDTMNGPTNFGEELVINGLSWPYTERLNYEQHETVHWRIINASNQVHPMHLHGFFFTITSKGNLSNDSIYPKAFYRQAVTELLEPGETIAMRWIPEREGNWLFHCHTLVHIMPGSFLRQMDAISDDAMNNVNSHARNGMGGLIMGISVSPAGKIKELKNIPERQLTMVIGDQANYFDTLAGKGFKLYEKNKEIINNYSIPGPLIILTRDQPVAIKIINKLKESTTIHWHGLEIESYFDGVSGWGNRGHQLAPLIQPGDSFVVHMTPPRAGTYIYHTHMHNLQLLEGLSGPLIVLEPGQQYHPEKDKIFFISQGDEDFERHLFFLNGTNKTDTMKLKRNVSYRFRQINITALGPSLCTSLLFNGKPFKWRLIAKDGADLPKQQQLTKTAFMEKLSIGETKDFEFKTAWAGDYLFEVRNTKNGKLFLRKLIQVN